MKHYVFNQVLFTLGKEYDSDTENLHLNYVNCQWQNYDKEVCEVDILVSPDEFDDALEGSHVMREFIFSTFAFHLMAVFNPSIIS